MNRKAALLLSLLLLSLPSLTQADTGFWDAASHGVDMAFGILIIVCMFFLWIIVGIVFAFMSMVFLVMLVSMGILSTSIVVGLNQKSFNQGFKTLIILSSTVACTALCTTAFWALHLLLDWGSTFSALVLGGLFGVFSGLVIGLAAYYLLRLVLKFYKAKYFLK